MRKKQFSVREYFGSLFFRPRIFYSTFYSSKSDIPKYVFWILFFIFAFSLGIDQVDSIFSKAHLDGTLDALADLNYWPLYFVAALIFGLIKGLILYWIAGVWYYLRLRFSGAVIESKIARQMYLTSSFAWDIVFVLTTLISMTFHPAPYMPESVGAWYDFIVYIFLIIFYFYSVAVSYISVKTLTTTRLWARRILFLILPCVWYLVIIFSGVLLNIYMAYYG